MLKYYFFYFSIVGKFDFRWDVPNIIKELRLQ